MGSVKLKEIDSGEVVFIDSNIFIYEFSSHEEFGPPCLEFLRRVEETDVLGVTSVNVLDEVLYKSMLIEISNIEDISISEASVELRDSPEKINKLERSISNVKELFGLPILVLDTKKRNFREGLTNVRKYRLRPHDATILQTIKSHGIESIATKDSDFERVEWLDVYRPGRE